jgi:predicted 3-demethylubiquinone-9 3-methyltransferase (glyoxalase superfamily)
MQTIVPCLWFDSQAEEAANHYVSIFKDGKILEIARYGKEGFDVHGRPEGSVMTVLFELRGQRFMGLNGGPVFKFTEAVSFEITCETQEEVDHFWERLGEGGDEAARQCGWLKDKYGLSWQVTPRRLAELMADPDKAKAGRVMNAMLKMKKIDIAELEAAAAAE